MQTRSFVGLDVHKATISVSVAEDGRNGEVRILGAMPSTPDYDKFIPSAQTEMPIHRTFITSQVPKKPLS